MSVVTCAFCGEHFAEDQGQPACAACPLRGGCRYLRCPHCGYENPSAPAWVARLRRWLHTDQARELRPAGARRAGQTAEGVEAE